MLSSSPEDVESRILPLVSAHVLSNGCYGVLVVYRSGYLE